MPERIYCLLIGYGFGMFLTAAAVVYAKTGRSVREFGSGNPGMANVTEQFGVKTGALVLAGDIAKTAIACILCRVMFGLAGPVAALYAGVGAALGHNYPIWRHGKGGKGVAVTCTALACASPLWGVLSSIAGLAAVLATGYLSIGAILIPLVFVPLAAWLYGAEAGALAGLLAAMMLLRHRAALRRIAAGREKHVWLLPGQKQAHDSK